MTLTHWILVLTAFAVLLLIVAVILLLKKQSPQSGVSGKDIALLGQSVAQVQTDMARVERTLTAGNENVKNRVTEALRTLADKTYDFTKQNYDTQVRITESIAALQEKMSASDKESAAAVAAAVEKLQASNEKKLDEMRATVDEKLTGTLNERLDASFRTVSEQLSKVYRSLGEMQEMSDGISSLNRVLKGVKTRGNWAETQLQGLLDQIVPGMYETNFRPGNTGDVVEFAVRIPSAEGGEPMYMPIDSKFPMEDYLRLCDAMDAGDAEGVKSARKSLEGRVLNEAKEVKKYICPPRTTPFAVLYLATDSLFAEIMASKSNLADKLHSEYRVLLAGPSTITALLSSLAMGFRSVALNEKAGEVMKLLAAAKAQYAKFEDALTAAQNSIEQAGKKLGEAQKRNRIIQTNLRDVETLDGETAQSVLAIPESV